MHSVVVYSSWLSMIRAQGKFLGVGGLVSHITGIQLE